MSDSQKDRNAQLEQMLRDMRKNAALQQTQGEFAAHSGEVKQIGDKKVVKSILDSPEESERRAQKTLNELMNTLEFSMKDAERKPQTEDKRQPAQTAEKQKPAVQPQGAARAARPAYTQPVTTPKPTQPTQTAQPSRPQISSPETAKPIPEPIITPTQKPIATPQPQSNTSTQPPSFASEPAAPAFDKAEILPESASQQNSDPFSLKDVQQYEFPRSQLNTAASKTQDVFSEQQFTVYTDEPDFRQYDEETAPSETSYDFTSIIDVISQQEESTSSFSSLGGGQVDAPSRSLLDALRVDTENLTDKHDPINKDMLAPKIERGTDTITTEIVIDDVASATQQNYKYAENHSIFNSSTTSETYIPLENRQSDGTDLEFSSTNIFSPVVSPLTDKAKRADKKGVLNVRENVDDSFREFFGDTVIIDRENLNEKAKRQRKIKDFVLADNEGGVGGPVFEDDDEELEEGAVVYKSDEDTEAVLSELSSIKAKETLKTFMTGLFAAVLVIANVLFSFRLLPASFIGAPAFYGLNAILMLACIIVNAKTIFIGIGKLATFKASRGAFVSFSCIAALIESAVMLLLAQEDAQPLAVTSCVAASAMFFCDMGEMLNARRILSSFCTVSESFDKYASAVMDDQDFTRRITRELEINSPLVLLKRKTGFTDNFLPHTQSSSETEHSMGLISSIVFYASIAVFAVVMVLQGSLSDAARYFALFLAFASPFICTLCEYLPVVNMQKYLSKYSSVVPGYSAAYEVCAANCVVLEGRELFPKGNVMLHGIKTFDRERIDKAILYAASVLIQSSDTLSPVFSNVIQGKTEMLYNVDSVEYEGGIGFSFWVDKSRVLLGTRELLSSHEIEVPSRDYENRYTKTSTRDAIYLAVSGKLYAMFVVSYSPNAEVESALHGFEREGVSILVHTKDFNLSSEKIAKIYRIPQRMISIVKETDITALSEKTNYVSHAPSSLTHIGSLTSFVKGIIACYNVRSAVKLSSTIGLATMLLGIVLAAVLAVSGMLTSVGVLSALMFQIICTVLTTIVMSVHRY